MLAVHVVQSMTGPYRALARFFAPRRSQSVAAGNCASCGRAMPVTLAPGGEMEAYIASRIGQAREEQLLCLYFDPDGRFRAESGIGGGVAQIVAARAQLVESARDHGAHHVVIAHNHPGGDAAPSRQDVLATRQVHRLYAALGMSLADHVIVARGGASFSFRRAGLL